MPFKNRAKAGRKLAAALAGYVDQNPVILALPRGAVPVAAEVAAAIERTTREQLQKLDEQDDEENKPPSDCGDRWIGSEFVSGLGGYFALWFRTLGASVPPVSFENNS